MADTYAQLPDGRYVQVPEGMDGDTFAATLRKSGLLPSPDAPKSPMATLNESVAQERADKGNVWEGMKKGAEHTAIDLGRMVHAIPGVGAATDAIGNAVGDAVGRIAYGQKTQPVDPSTEFQNAREATAYSNPLQRVGGAIETVGEMAIPVGRAADALPSAVRAGKNFDTVLAAAKNVPIDTAEVGDVALKIANAAQHGGGTNWGPGPVRQLIQYLTDPKKPAMTYDVSKEFASNISRLSAEENMRIPPAMMSKIGDLRVALNAANAKAAGAAGVGEEYAAAMAEYAKAMKWKDAVDTAWTATKSAFPYIAKGAALTAGAATAADLFFHNQLKGLLP